MIFKIIEELRSTSSTLAKTAILEKNKDNELLKKVIFFTYNPRYTYDIKKIPEYNTINTPEFKRVSLNDSIDKLLKLVDRTYTGNDGIVYLSSILSTTEETEVIKLIIDRDLKAGVNVALINKTFKDLIPEEPYQGCLSYSEKLIKELFKTGHKIISQVKEDGQYINAVINDCVELKARSGDTQYINSKIINALQKLNISNYVLNGEFIIKGYPRSIANGIINSITTINEKIYQGKDVNKDIQKFIKTYNNSIEFFEDNIQYKVWDIIPYDEYNKGLSKDTYETRLNFLKILLEDNDDIILVEGKMVNNYKEAIEHFRDLLSKGAEGTVVKDLEALWQDGKHKHQLKMKLEIDLDLEIIGFNEGNKGTKYEGTLGSLILASSDRKIISACAGMKEKSGIRDEIWNNQEKYLGKIVSTKCNGISSNKSGGYGLYYAAFNEIRNDKFTADSFEDCMKIQEMKCQLS